MLILKCATFSFEHSLVDFVNKNNIARENIVTITRAANMLDSVQIAIFYYEDEEIGKEAERKKNEKWF